MFDYGTNCELQSAGPGAFRESCNQARYGQPDPPAYDLSRVTARAALLEGARAAGGPVQASRTWQAAAVC